MSHFCDKRHFLMLAFLDLFVASHHTDRFPTFTTFQMDDLLQEFPIMVLLFYRNTHKMINIIQTDKALKNITCFVYVINDELHRGLCHVVASL